jgi:predicted aldo/keto reductase-like oxidoreductase
MIYNELGNTGLRVSRFGFGCMRLPKIDHYDWEICQMQLNILDQKHRAGLAGSHYASGKGIPCVIMEPIHGGAMANNIPESVSKTIEEFPQSRPPLSGLSDGSMI